MSVIPVIDIAPARNGDAAARRKVADQIAAACESVGFLMVTGHGISQTLIDEVDQLSRDFFDLPDEEKLAVNINPNNPSRGYRRVGMSTLARGTDDRPPPDLRESFVIGPEIVPGDPYYTSPAGARFFQTNVWPEKPERLRAAYKAYYDACADLARDLMRLFALALDLPETFFDEKIDKHISAFNVNHYPKQDVAAQPNQLRAAAHTDYGSLTILSTDGSPGGLQVLVDDQWQDVMPVAGAFIINLGDLMAQWTNMRWRSTRHRVINPPQDVAASTRRLSLVFFHEPNYDARVECIPSCLAPDETPLFAPTPAGERLMSELAKTYAKKPAAAAA